MECNKALFEAQIANRELFEEQFEVRKWLQGKTKGTEHTYLSALNAFIEFTGHPPKELIDLAEEDRKKSPRERGDPEWKVKSFFDWLISEYVQKDKGSFLTVLFRVSSSPSQF